MFKTKVFYMTRFSAVFLYYFAFCTAYTVDVSFEITAVYKLCENVLLIYGNCAGIESEALFKPFQQAFGQYHISNTDRRSYGS